MLVLKGTTKVLGVFGYPIEHSLSPIIHNAALTSLGLDFCYVPFKVHPDRLALAVEGIRALGIVGVNVTIPHKVSIMEYLDEISPEAEALGAVNTIVNDHGKLKGYNTDGQGFLRSLREDAGVEPKGKAVFLIGAGGAAKSIAVRLGLEGARSITIANRTFDKAKALADLVNGTLGGKLASPETLDGSQFHAPLYGADIIINSTPVGMYPHQDDPPILDSDLIREGVLVCDLIYNPIETTLLKSARMRGARTLNGVGMLVHQGAIAFNMWTGAQAPVDIMREALIDALGEPK
jgi:shikimate dehydrogenase